MFIRVLTAVTLIGVLAGCTGVPRDSAAVNPATFNLRRDLSTLRDPAGLFVDPTYYDTHASVYSTALLDEAFGIETGKALDRPTKALELCSSRERTEVGEPWFTWSLVRVIGPGAPCADLTVPARSGDAEDDIPRFYAWTDAALRSGIPREDVIPQLGDLLQHAPILDPYVMWRQDQLEELLGLSDTSASRPHSLPLAVRSPDDLTGVWGHTMRCMRASVCPAGAVPSNGEVVQLATVLPDDLSLAGALAILRSRGAKAEVEALRYWVDKRRQGRDGLVRLARFLGTIEATFSVLKLAPELFPGPDPAVTARELERRLELLPPSDRLQRLRALAVLRAVDPVAWEVHRAEADATGAAMEGVVVTQSSLTRHVMIGAALAAMGLGTPTATLELFPARDERSEYEALVAVSYAWSMTNDAAILTEYSNLRTASERRAHDPQEPVRRYVMSLKSLSGPGVDISQQRRAEISSAAGRSLQGCSMDEVKSEVLYRFTLEGNSACSLEVTMAMIESSFGRIS